MKKIFLVFLTGLFLLTACEEDIDKQAASAQQCLDRARSSADANVCLATISSSSRDSRILRVRCGLKFLSYNITQATLVTAFSNMLQSTNFVDGNPMINMAVAIKVTNAGGQADDLVNTCVAAGSTGLIMMANAAKLGGITDDVAGNCASTPINAACEGDVAALPASTVGDIAVTTYNSYCAGGKSDPVCNAISNSIAAGGCSLSNPTCIGTQLKLCLANPSCH